MRAPDFWRAGSGGWQAALLSPLGAVYGRVTAFRAARPPTWTAPVPTICIGNVVMGGAGKTLVVLDIVDRLMRRGHAPHVLLRGYGGRLKGPLRVDPARHTAADVGDEALLAAARAPTWIGADRVGSAMAATAAGAGALVMDDGFQNPALAKTLGILVVDGDYGFGNGHCFPAGPLREQPTGALARAQGIVRLGNGTRALGNGVPEFTAVVTARPGAPDLMGKTVVAFAGIGRPEKFFGTLTDLGAEIVQRRAFADHHPFTAGDIVPLAAAADKNGALLVTTEKDHVRLPVQFAAMVTALPVGLRWDDEVGLTHFLVSGTGLT